MCNWQVSPGELYSGHRHLFDALLAAIATDSAALLDELADSLGLFYGSAATFVCFIMGQCHCAAGRSHLNAGTKGLGGLAQEQHL